MASIAKKDIVLLAAIEFKFIQKKDKRWVNLIEKDAKKLKDQQGILLKYVLVFDNINLNLNFDGLKHKYPDIHIVYIQRGKK